MQLNQTRLIRFLTVLSVLSIIIISSGVQRAAAQDEWILRSPYRGVFHQLLADAYYGNISAATVTDASANFVDDNLEQILMELSTDISSIDAGSLQAADLSKFASDYISFTNGYNLDLSGLGSGFVTTDNSGVITVDTSTYLTGNETITLSGDVTGSGATSITATVVDDSHAHDTQYYTETEIDAFNYVPLDNFIPGSNISLATSAIDNTVEISSTASGGSGGIADITGGDNISVDTVAGATQISATRGIELYKKIPLTNHDFETGDLTGWNTTDFEVVQSHLSNTSAAEGSYFLADSDSTTPNVVTATQAVQFTSTFIATDFIAGGSFSLNYYISSSGPSDIGSVALQFFDGSGIYISSATKSYTTGIDITEGVWLRDFFYDSIPTTTESIILVLQTQTNGTAAASVTFDDVSISLFANELIDSIEPGENITLSNNGNALIISATDTGATTANELNDFEITTPSIDEVIKYDGTNWVNGALPGGGGISNITSITVIPANSFWADESAGYSNSSYAAKGNVYDVSQPTVLGSIDTKIDNDTEGRVYQLVIAELNVSYEIQEIIFESELYSDALNGEMTFDCENTNLSAAKYAFLLVVTNGTSTTPSRVQFDTNAGLSVEGWLYDTAVRWADNDPAVGETVDTLSNNVVVMKFNYVAESDASTAIESLGLGINDLKDVGSETADTELQNGDINISLTAGGDLLFKVKNASGTIGYSTMTVTY